MRARGAPRRHNPAPARRRRVDQRGSRGRVLSGELKGLAEPASVLTPPALATSNDDLLTASKIATPQARCRLGRAVGLQHRRRRRHTLSDATVKLTTGTL